MRRPPSPLIAAAIVGAALTVGCATGSPSQATPSGASSDLPTASPASREAIAPVSPAARAEGFVDIRTVVPDALVDLRYATPHNFVGVRLYPVDARCLVHESMTAGLRSAARQLRTTGDTLVFWDCYRPHSVQVRMYQKVPDPAWVAAPGPYSRSHESGRSVDVSLAIRNPTCPAPQRIGDHCLVDMGTDFDDFSPAATAFAVDGVSPTAQRNRARLRTAMASGGLSAYSGEWWHFDGAGAGVRRPIIDVPVN